MREIVLIHGGGVGPWMWRPLLHELGDRAVVHTPTMAGHQVGDATNYDGPESAAADIAREVRIEDRGDLVVAGFSAGGQVALELAAQFPAQVSALVVVSTLVEPLPARRILEALGAVTAPLARRPGFARRQGAALGVPEEDMDAYVAGSVAFSTESLDRLLRTNLAYSPPPAVTRHPRPMTLMAGSREQRAVRGGLRRLAATASGARYTEVAGAHHDIPMRWPAVLAEELGRAARRG